MFTGAIQLRGLSFHGVQWYANCVTYSALSHLVMQWGVNLFRIPIYLESSEGGYFSNPNYFDGYIDDVVTWTRNLEVYMIIDFHVLTKGRPQ